MLMDLISKTYNAVHTSESLPPNPSSTSSIFAPRVLHSSSDTSFPIIAIAVIGILATAFLLVGYYIFVIKCCLNWHRIDILRRFSLSRRRNEDPLMTYASPVETRGLDESVIRSIPVLKFKKTGDLTRDLEGRDLSECAVCLNEFQEDEKLRVIPNCSHVFHIDCIDVWLQSNSNCPLCRTSISSNTFPANKTRTPFSSSLDPNPYPENLMGGDDNFVVIELGNHNSTNQTVSTLPTVLTAQERFSLPTTISPPRKLEQRIAIKKGRKLLHKVTSMGDECINTRGQDEQFIIQPIRRSFSMDSSGDRQLYLAVQEAVRKNSLVDEVISPIEGCSSGNSSRVRRSFFSFGSGRGSRNAVSPLSLEP